MAGVHYLEVYSELNQASKMGLFVKIFSWWKPLTTFAKSAILHVWLRSNSASGTDFSVQWKKKAGMIVFLQAVEQDV